MVRLLAAFWPGTPASSGASGSFRILSFPQSAPMSFRAPRELCFLSCTGTQADFSPDEAGFEMTARGEISRIMRMPRFQPRRKPPTSPATELQEIRLVLASATKRCGPQESSRRRLHATHAGRELHPATASRHSAQTQIPICHCAMPAR